MPEAYESSLANLFEGSQLRIPLYQRSYAWEPQQVADLLGDIEYIDQRLDAAEETNVYHYFGTVVLDNRGDLNVPGTDDWEKFDIIDGQQRITTISVLMGAIAEELDELQTAFDEAGISTDQLPPEILDLPGRKAEAERRRYVKKGTQDSGRHLNPGRLTEDAYEKLIVDQQTPEQVLENQDLVPAQKLARAKSEIQDWILVKRKDACGTQDLSEASPAALIEYYDRLYQLIRVVSSKFKLTVHEVPSADEAGRLFEAVNDRGRDITLSDKVRSYLIYVAGEFDGLDTTQVARKFNEAVETVAMYADDDAIVDQFIRFHWEMYTGEHKDIRSDRDPSDIHRRIKHSPRHAPISRPPEEVVAWTETYVQSLQDAADAFVEAKYLDVFLDRYSVDDRTVSRLVSLHNYNFSNLTPLVMALLINTQPSDDQFFRIIDQLETYSFRVYQVMKRSRRIGRREFKEAAHRLYVAGHPGDYVDELLGGSVTDTPYSSIEEAIPGVAFYIDSFIGQHCPDSDFIEHLTKSDVISGSDTRGWPGFCNKSAIRYLLYEYERHLRVERGSDSSLNQLPDVRSLDSEFTLEHIAPQTPESEGAFLDNHDDNVNRLGNLALLGPRDNSSADNDDFGSKYRQVYADAQMLMLQSDLPRPETGWSVEQIDRRENALVSFCVERWSGESIAHITLQGGDADLVEQAVSSPASAVSLQLRSDVARTAGSNSGHVPSTVRIRAQASDGSLDAGENRSQCCGSVLTLVTASEDGGIVYSCVCGNDLSEPNYEFSIS
jgi:hypothetical protein